MPLESEQVSALKHIFKEISHEGFVTSDEIESLSEKIFVGEKKASGDVLKLAMDPILYDDDKINETRFIAQIERIFDVSSSEGIIFHYSVTIALHCMVESQRAMYESSGKYCQAEEAQNCSRKLRDFELLQRQNALHFKQTRDLIHITKAHEDQYISFVKEWNSFESDFVNRAEQAIESTRKRHEVSLEEYKRKLQIEARGKPRLFSKELKEWRKKQKILAQQENYPEAQKVKVISDGIEEEETMNINANNDNRTSVKTKCFQNGLEAEMKALTKRINSQKDANKQTREDDCKRLYQRNKNIQIALKSRYAIEEQKEFSAIEKCVQNEISQYKKRWLCDERNLEKVVV